MTRKRDSVLVLINIGTSQLSDSTFSIIDVYYSRLNTSIGMHGVSKTTSYSNRLIFGTWHSETLINATISDAFGRETEFQSPDKDRKV